MCFKRIYLSGLPSEAQTVVVHIFDAEILYLVTRLASLPF